MAPDELTPGILKSEYEERREKLMQSLPEGSLMVCGMCRLGDNIAEDVGMSGRDYEVYEWRCVIWSAFFDVSLFANQRFCECIPPFPHMCLNGLSLATSFDKPQISGTSPDSKSQMPL